MDRRVIFVWINGAWAEWWKLPTAVRLEFWAQTEYGRMVGLWFWSDS